MIVRQIFPDLVLEDMLPALDELIFQEFDPYPPQFTRYFRVMTSNRAIEQTTQMSGLGLAVKIPENNPMVFDTPVQGFDKTFRHDQYGLGFMASRIFVDDDKFGVIKKMAKDLGVSIRETIEIEVASHFNNGFTGGAFVGPDGVALFSTSHPLVKYGGVQANTPAVGLDLDHGNLSLALTDYRLMKDPSGRKVRVPPEELVVPPQLEGVAAEIMEARMRSDTANNTPNSLRHRSGYGSFTQWSVWDYLTDDDAWFVLGNKKKTQLRFYWKEKPNTYHDIDFHTRAIMTCMWYRKSHGWSDYMGTYGSPGI